MQKNEATSSIYSREIVDLKILQSDWLRAFRPISQEQDFSQYSLCAGTANNINFQYRTNSVKINLNSVFFKISLNSRPYFSSIFGPVPKLLEQKRFSPKTPALSRTTS